MEALQQYLSNHPQDLADWLDQFPWDSFGAEITIHEDMEEKVVIAKKVILQPDAEVTSLLICQEAQLEEGAEVKGTLVCDKVQLNRDAECNYLIACRAEVGEDAEIRSAIVSDSLKMADRAEIDELEILDATFIDLGREGLIDNRNILSSNDFQGAIAQRLQLVLEGAINQLS